MRFLSIKKYSKILRIKIKSVYVKDFLISTKVRLKRVEHLQSEEIFSCELYFSVFEGNEITKPKNAQAFFRHY